MFVFRELDLADKLMSLDFQVDTLKAWLTEGLSDFCGY